MHTTRILGLLLSLTSMGLVSIGCSCSTPEASDAGRDAPTGADVPEGLDAGPTDAPEGIDAPAPLDAGNDVATVDAPSSVTVEISDFSIFGNCMPIVPPDPIIATWTLTVEGASGATARFVTGTLTFSGGASQTITVEDDTIALVAGSGTGEQRRAGGTPAVPGCGTVCSASETATLQATYEVDGGTIQVEASGPYSCAF